MSAPSFTYRIELFFPVTANPQKVRHFHQVINITLHQTSVCIRWKVDDRQVPDRQTESRQFCAISSASISSFPRKCSNRTNWLLFGSRWSSQTADSRFRRQTCTAWGHRTAHVRIPQPEIRREHLQGITLLIVGRQIALIWLTRLVAIFAYGQIYTNLALGLQALYAIIDQIQTPLAARLIPSAIQPQLHNFTVTAIISSVNWRSI